MVNIPSGNFVLQEGDKISITASPSELDSLFRKLGIYRQKIHRVMVVGGGRIAYYLAKQLLKLGMSVKIIDKDPLRCEQLSDALPKAQIVLGDGSDRELLTLYVFEGYTVTEIARMQGVSQPVISKKLNRLKKYLKNF